MDMHVLGVGLDVERWDRLPRDVLGLARRRLAPQEYAQLLGKAGLSEQMLYMRCNPAITFFSFGLSRHYGRARTCAALHVHLDAEGEWLIRRAPVCLQGGPAWPGYM